MMKKTISTLAAAVMLCGSTGEYNEVYNAVRQAGVQGDDKLT